MKILVIIPYYHPLEHPRAHRWKELVDFFVKQGAHVTVITAHDGITRSETTEEEVLAVGYSTPDKRLSSEPHANRKIPGQKLGGAIMKSWMWPDESMFWIKPALKKAREVLSGNSYDWMITVSHPFSSHVIGSRLHSQFSINWMVDIGDPFIQKDAPPRNNPVLWKIRNEIVERRILQTADQVVVTHPKLESHYQTTYGPNLSIKTIGPMRSPLGTTLPSRPKDDIVKLGYFGTFYDAIRSPLELCQGIRNWTSSRKIELHIFGHVKERHRQILARNLDTKVQLILHENVQRSEVLSQMQSMDILLLQENTTSMQIPSKWADYLTAQRPIIVYGGSGENTPFSASHIRYYQEGSLDLDHVSKAKVDEVDLTRFSPETIGKQYWELMKESVE